MLEPYISPVAYAFMSFPVAALLFTLPFLIMQYRRHGYVNWLRSFLLYLFLLYLINALFLVILPLPTSRHNAPMASGYTQLVPFQFVSDIMKETGIVLDQPSTYMRLFKERAVLQVLFNVMLTMPLGMFLRYYARVNWKTGLILSFSMALFFEITQVTAIYGYYDYPYRLFDVDDLMLNTLGGMTGYVVASWLSAVLPRMESLDAGVDLAKKRVSYTRRAIALLFDWMVLLPVMLVLFILDLKMYGIAAFILYFLLVPYWTNGMTLGKALVRIRIVGSEERLAFKEVVVRNGILYGGWWGLNALFAVSAVSSGLGMLHIIGALLLLIVNGWLFIHLLACLFNRNRVLLHERISRTTHAIIPPKRLAKARSSEDELSDNAEERT
ncbi:VanZ family protein [Paenibacillaceae bacterium]|nr:VanZ family protein [Paenibacillaceae bacterium]